MKRMIERTVSHTLVWVAIWLSNGSLRLMRIVFWVQGWAKS